MSGPATFKLWISFATEAFATPTWVDCSQWCLEAQFATSSRTSRFDTFAAGYGTFVLDNDTRLFEPGYAGAVFAKGGDLKRHQQVKVTAEHATTEYTVWRGWTRSWQVSYEGRFRSNTTARCTDALGVLASFDLAKVDPATGAGDQLKGRFDTVIAEVGFPAGLVDTTYARQTGPFSASTFGDGALSHLTGLAAAEGSILYADRDGVITLEERHTPGAAARQTTSQQSFDDTTEPAYEALTWAAAGDQYRDIVRISGVSGVVQEVDNSAVDAAPVAFQKLNTDLNRDGSAASAAAWFADLYSTETPHPTTMSTTIATAGEDIRTAILPRRLRDRITVTFDPPGGGADITADCFIDGIEHDVTPARWRVRYTLSSADAYDDNLAAPPADWFVLNTDLLGTGKLGY